MKTNQNRLKLGSKKNDFCEIWEAKHELSIYKQGSTGGINGFLRALHLKQKIDQYVKNTSNTRREH